MSERSSPATRPLYSTKLADYTDITPIGHGATATVYKGRHDSADHNCAMKKINLQANNIIDHLQEVTREIKMLQNLKHENIVEYYQCFLDGSDLWLIMELLNKGSLYHLIRDKKMYLEKLGRGGPISHGKPGIQGFKTQLLSDETIAVLSVEILAGLKYLHKQNIIHRDIKCRNILLSKNGCVKLADLGIAAKNANAAWLDGKKHNNYETLGHKELGTPCWMAPEVCDSSVKYDTKCDIFSFSICLIEMVCEVPLDYDLGAPIKIMVKRAMACRDIQNNPDALMDAKNHITEKLRYFLPEKLLKFINFGLFIDPQKRPTAEEYLKKGFLAKALTKKLTPDSESNKNHLKEMILEVGKLKTEIYGGSPNDPAPGKRFSFHRITKEQQEALRKKSGANKLFNLSDSITSTSSFNARISVGESSDPSRDGTIDGKNNEATDTNQTKKHLKITINLKIRVADQISNTNNLQIITFEYDTETDNPASICSLMAEDGILTKEDVPPIANGLNSLVDEIRGAIPMALVGNGQNEQNQNETIIRSTDYLIKLTGAPENDDQGNKDNLVGYARLFGECVGTEK